MGSRLRSRPATGERGWPSTQTTCCWSRTRARRSGYVLARRNPFQGTDAEIMALHVRAASRGRGYGTALLRAALLALQAKGAQSVGLSTLEAHTSRAWYERLNGQPGGVLTQTYGDHVVREVVFSWPAIRALLTHLESPPIEAHPINRH
ncbi:GNAT family N-acetyltransferase [Deinococcus sp. HMF7604]|uniref:GNAT family N-acetyltransferase n=1 Tax=Deinococcus betulae TaxID=2873312 RepID=UPI001CCB3D8E|nr:GNAT family N-acetyltransferase [Deinococcus betulae]